MTNKPAGKCHAKNVTNFESGSRPESHFFQMELMKIKPQEIMPNSRKSDFSPRRRARIYDLFHLIGVWKNNCVNANNPEKHTKAKKAAKQGNAGERPDAAARYTVKSLFYPVLDE